MSVVTPVLPGPAATSPLAAASPLEAWQHRRLGTAPRGSHRAGALARELGRGPPGPCVVHVVGTNGKSSVVRLVAAVLTALGLRTGDTTSPHLSDVGERIRVDGRPLTAGALAPVAARLPDAVRRAEARLGEPVTFFDVVTSVALAAFAEAGVEVAVVEAGIGGAGDATGGLAAPVLALTPIGLDHPQLGATHAEVAGEKAGVIAPGATVLSAVQHPAAGAVIAARATARGARLRCAGRDFGVLARRPTGDGQTVLLRGLDGLRVRTHLSLHGAHQAANAALALAVVQAALPGRALAPGPVVAGLAAVRAPGRLEVLAFDAVRVVLDGAHDPDATASCAAALGELAPGRRAVVVLGVTAGRDPAAILAPLRSRAAGVVVTAPDVPGATPAGRVAARLRTEGVRTCVEHDPAAALARAAAAAGPEGVVLVTGSLALVGQVRADQRLHAGSVAP